MLKCDDYLVSDFVLDLEDILQFSIVGVGPEVRPIMNADQLSSDADMVSLFADTPLQNALDPELSPIVRRSSPLPLNENEDVRPVTRNRSIFASRFNNSSDIPSLKYSWSFAGLRFAKGSTAIDASFPPASLNAHRAWRKR